MSEELEWELFEIFESARFAFPIYDHKSARQIIHYLLRRGVLEEEIADAIEDSTVDLMIWLKRAGKYMVGEWVISWVNETREEYLRELEIERMHLDELSHEVTPGQSLTTSESGDTEDYRSQAHIRRHSQSETHSDATEMSDSETEIKECVSDDGVDEASGDDVPPPLPPRTLRRSLKLSRAPKDGIARHHSPSGDSDENLYDSPPEGATGSSSTIHSSIPGDSIVPDSLSGDQVVTVVTEADHNQNIKCTNCTLANSDVFQLDNNGLPVKALCTCTLAHYSYIRQLKEAEHAEDNCDLYFSDTNNRAMEINIDTLDKDGPGFIFIMTDSLRECMPWSAESRYKVASSRKPERCLLEFRSRNVDIDLIWQVKVEHHIIAVKEVHLTLCKYNLHSNWFRCSLSEIMEAIAKVIKKYKHK